MSEALPASIAWSTIALLILLGIIQEFGRFQPALETTLAITLMILLIFGGPLSLFVFSLSRRKRQGAPSQVGFSMRQGILDGEVRAWWISVISPLEDALINLDWKPNFITVLSFLFSLLGCLLFVFGWQFFAGWMIIFGGTLDILDGRIARRTGMVSRQGAFFDSVLDRYGELLIFIGLAVYFKESALFYLVLLALVGSLMVSYTRARAEGLGVACLVGMMQRPERVVLLGVGAIFSSILHMLRGSLGADLGPYLMGLVLGLIAILANYTALSRMVHVMRELKEGEQEDNLSRTSVDE